MRVEIRPLAEALRDDFFRFHASFTLPDHPEAKGGWCFCAAWWVPSWDGWGARSAAENRRVREDLLDRGEHDGYLLYVDGEPAGWCQVGPRDRLEKLTRTLGLAADPDAWAITCFLMGPRFRRRGLATRLLEEVLATLRARGVRRVEAFPKRGDALAVDDLWNGPEAMFARQGFQVVREDGRRPVLSLELQRARM